MTTMIETMRVIDAPTPGEAEALVICERPAPRPAAGEVLIQVAAAGINRADILQRRGAYPPPPGAPAHPGLEVAGTVIGLGAGVSEFALGARVCALLAGGGYAELCTAPTAKVLPIPAGLDFVAAASLPEAWFTIWSNLCVFGRLQQEDRLLVHGGTSGIGVAAMQLARALGNEVFATAGSADKCRFTESLGARRGIDYRQEDFVAVLHEVTSDYGVDVILDLVGGSYLARNLEALAPDGRLVVIATQQGTSATLDLRLVMRKRLLITGSMLRPRSVAFKAGIKAALLQQVWPLIERGQIRPIVDRVFAFDAAAAAHAYMERGEHKGKIILALPGAQ